MLRNDRLSLWAGTWLLDIPLVGNVNFIWRQDGFCIAASAPALLVESALGVHMRDDGFWI